jgi:putative ABC transport system permease protein
MNALRQTLVVTALGFRGLHNRLWSSLVVVAGVGLVVAILVSVLSLTAGITRSYAGGAGPQRVIILSAGARNEDGSGLSREAANFIIDRPGLSKTPDGAPMGDAEVIGSLPTTKKASGLEATLTVRGMGPKGLLLHPKIQIVSGRMFRAGAREAIIGIAAQQQFADLAVGQTVTLQHGRWPVVGVFKADGDLLESQLIGDADTLLPALGRKAYNSVIADLASPGAFASFRHDLTLNPAFKVAVERQSDYYARGTKTFSDFFHAVAYILGGLMAIGAVFGTVNTLYAAVSARAREIATLRALGFGAVAVATSVILEALFLSLTGAVIGAASAWLLFNGHQKVLGGSVFSLSINLSLAGIGIVWACAIALIGAALPSIRAARMAIVTALRAV